MPKTAAQLRTSRATLGIFGEPRVNVLLLNLAWTKARPVGQFASAYLG